MTNLRHMAVRAFSEASPLAKTTVLGALNKLSNRSRYASVALASLHLADDQPDKAASAYQRAAEMVAQPAKYDLMAIRVLIDRNCLAEATQHIARLAGRQEDTVWFDALITLATLIEKRGMEKEGLCVATDLAESFPAAAGILLCLLGDTRSAETLLQALPWDKHQLRTYPAFQVLKRTWHQDGENISTRHLVGARMASIADHLNSRACATLNTMAILEGDPDSTPFSRRPQGALFVLAEPNASVESIKALNLSRAQQVILFSGSDRQTEEARLIGIETRSVKDLVPDQAPVVDMLYAHAERTAKLLVNELISSLPQSDVLIHVSANRDTYELLLEDRIARVLSELEQFRAALRSCPEHADVLLLTSTGRHYLQYLPWLISQIGASRFYLLAPPQPAHKNQFLDGLRTILEGGALGPENSTWTSNTAPVDLEDAASLLDSWMHTTRESLFTQAETDLSALGDSTRFMIGNLVNRNYTDGNCELAKALQKTSQLLILTSNPNESAAWQLARESGELSQTQVQSLFQYQKECPSDDSKEGCRQIYQYLMHLPLTRALTYQGRSMWQLLEVPIHRTCFVELPAAMIEAAYLQRILSDERVRSLVVCPGRNRLARLGTSIAREHSVRSIDVQMVNTPGYRKYKAPTTDIITAIDDVARDLLTEYFGADSERITLVGSPRIDMFRDKVGACDRQQVIQELGIARAASRVVCFASQQQSMEKCLIIARALIDWIAGHPETSLLIKMHPREDSSREAAYQTMIAKSQAPDRVLLLRSYDMDKVYAACDALVTMYSNAAREALVLGKQVIIANFFRDPWPLRFDLPGLATGAYSAAELHDLLSGYESTSEPNEKASVGDYISRNGHLRDASSTRLIEQLVATEELAVRG